MAVIERLSGSGATHWIVAVRRLPPSDFSQKGAFGALVYDTGFH
jgi:hypothetical protein